MNNSKTYKNRILLEKWPMSKEDMFFELIQDLEIKVDKEEHLGLIAFFKNKEVWFEIWKDSKKEKYFFYCSYYRVWEVFEKEYKLNYVEIQSFIKDFIKNGSKSNCFTQFKDLKFTPDYKVFSNGKGTAYLL